MKTTSKLNLVAAALVSAMAFTTARAADLTAAETKSIAEEGFIYGLPIVMNYAVMYEYAVDKNSGQYKAPFNQINNEARVFTYKDTSVITPNSDTPYSILWTDLRAEPQEKEIREKLARLGDLAALSQEQKAAVMAGVKEGEAKIKQYLESRQKNINGLKVGSLFGDSAFYNGDWLKRAAAAQAGIYGNDSAEAMYPMTKTLANGEALDASKHNYTLTFAKDQFPPVNAFWSVTMYDGKSQLLIKNPINRYLINSPMLPNMKKNEDGSLTLYIQKNSPGKDKEANWLPAPNDLIYLVMRLY